MKKRKKNNFIKAVTGFIILTIIIIAVSSYFLSDELNISLLQIGLIFIVLGVINLIFFILYKVKIKSAYPDMIFGAIDNGVLVFAAVLGGSFAGVTGAIIGGVAGNTVTDGIGGLFEGYVAEHQRKFKIDNLRTSVSSSLGKMAGCLFGAGIGLIIVDLILLI